MAAVHIILYVRNQERSRQFYEAALGKIPQLDVPGMTEFLIGADAVLGLMPEEGIKKLLGSGLPDPSRASGIPRAEIYLRVDDPYRYYKNALSAGAKDLMSLREQPWGDLVAYCLDPDGHVLAFAKPINH